MCINLLCCVHCLSRPSSHTTARTAWKFLNSCATMSVQQKSFMSQTCLTSRPWNTAGSLSPPWRVPIGAQQSSQHQKNGNGLQKNPKRPKNRPPKSPEFTSGSTTPEKTEVCFQESGTSSPGSIEVN